MTKLQSFIIFFNVDSDYQFCFISLSWEKQKIVEKIETDKKENHGKVFKVKSNGYIYKGRVISPEKVEVYVYNEKAKEELKGE